jgi:hypothetical protein
LPEVIAGQEREIAPGECVDDRIAQLALLSSERAMGERRTSTPCSSSTDGLRSAIDPT